MSAPLPPSRLTTAITVTILSLSFAGTVVRALQLKNYAALLPFLTYDLRKEIAVAWVQALVESSTVLQTPEQVEGFLDAVAPLVVDQVKSPPPTSPHPPFLFLPPSHVNCHKTSPRWRL
jgi:hypothetical protein